MTTDSLNELTLYNNRTFVNAITRYKEGDGTFMAVCQAAIAAMEDVVSSEIRPVEPGDAGKSCHPPAQSSEISVVETKERIRSELVKHKYNLLLKSDSFLDHLTTIALGAAPKPVSVSLLTWLRDTLDNYCPHVYTETKEGVQFLAVLDAAGMKYE